jgi:hypothetical protein
VPQFGIEISKDERALVSGSVTLLVLGSQSQCNSLRGSGGGSGGGNDNVRS